MQMLPTTIHSILEIPELAACISRYLTPSEIVCAMATCQDWSQQLRPILWTNFCPRKPILENAALEANLHLIRTLRLQGYTECLDILVRGLSTSAAHAATDAATDSTGQHLARIPRCLNLRRVNITFDDNDLNAEAPSWPHLITLLRHNHGLTQLRIHCIASEPKEQFMTQLMDGVSALRRLQHIAISTGRMEVRMFLSIMQTCLSLPRLSEIYCDFSLYFNDDATQDGLLSGLETILKEAVVARTSQGFIGTKIKSFQPPSLRNDNGDLVLALLRSELSGLLTLELPKIIADKDPSYYEQHVREHCPVLRKLVIPVPAMASDGGQMACNFIRGAIGLETVRGGNLWNVVLPCDPSNVVRALVTYQCSTLEEMEFFNCESISSLDQQAILSSCRQLKRLWMPPRTTLKPQEGLQFQDVLDGEWVCLGMRELYLTLDRTIKVKAVSQAMRLESLALIGQTSTKDTGHKKLHTGERSGRETMAWAAKRVYSQLGRLVDLKVLSIGFVMTTQELVGKSLGYSFQWNLTLSRGWLAELSGLKNLRHLHLRTDYWTRMGQAEVEFMDAKWPLLESVTFKLSRGYSPETDLFLKLVQKPHWLWLQKRRPQLVFKTFKYGEGE